MWSDWSPLLTFAGVIIAGLFGAGGIVAWLRLRHDRKVGVAQQEIVEDDAVAARLKSIIEIQTASLIAPLQDRLRDVEGKVKALEEELAASRRKYWLAISYIRTLLTWIGRHLPEDVEHTAVPEPSPTLVEDI